MDLALVNFDDPTELRAFEKGKFELYTVGPMTLGRATYEPGWRWSEHVGPWTGETLCQVEHVGLVLSGQAVAKMDDGREIVMRVGDFFYVPPGHDRLGRRRRAVRLAAHPRERAVRGNVVARSTGSVEVAWRPTTRRATNQKPGASADAADAEGRLSEPSRVRLGPAAVRDVRDERRRRDRSRQELGQSGGACGPPSEPGSAYSRRTPTARGAAPRSGFGSAAAATAQLSHAASHAVRSSSWGPT